VIAAVIKGALVTFAVHQFVPNPYIAFLIAMPLALCLLTVERMYEQAQAGK
jgi:hypothetical protein